MTFHIDNAETAIPKQENVETFVKALHTKEFDLKIEGNFVECHDNIGTEE